MRTDDVPRAALQEQLAAVQFSASPYRRPIIGWMNDLDHLQPEEVRQFFRQWYVPANATVVVVENIFHRLNHADSNGESSRLQVILEATQEVATPTVFGIAIIVNTNPTISSKTIAG